MLNWPIYYVKWKQVMLMAFLLADCIAFLSVKWHVLYITIWHIRFVLNTQMPCTFIHTIWSCLTIILIYLWGFPSFLSETLKHVAATVAGVKLSDHVVELVFTLFDENGEICLHQKIMYYWNISGNTCVGILYTLNFQKWTTQLVKIWLIIDN